ncbi:hypothetical protein MRX96_034624 [Rhipicephalus microplus]
MSQVERLKLAGYPDTEVLRGCPKLIKWVKGIPQLRDILEVDGYLTEIASDGNSMTQAGVVNSPNYFIDFYLENRSIEQSYSQLPKFMCYTLSWRKHKGMEYVHQNPLYFAGARALGFTPNGTIFFTLALCLLLERLKSRLEFLQVPPQLLILGLESLHTCTRSDLSLTGDWPLRLGDPGFG